MRIKTGLSLALFLTLLSVAFAEDPNGLFFKPIPAKTVAFTFDDGCLSGATIIAPLLAANGFGGTFYITEYATFTNKDWYMTWGQISNLNAMGFEVGNHTSGHVQLGASGLGTCRNQIAVLENDLIANGTTKSTTMAWPIYSVNTSYYECLYGQGYGFARGGGERPYNPEGDSPFNIPSYTISDGTSNNFYKVVTNAIAGKIVVICFHGIPDLEHPSVGLQPSTFTNMVQYLKTNNYNVISLRDIGKYVGRSPGTLVTKPVAGLTSSSAVLNASLQCGGLTNTVYAYWGAVNAGTNAELWANSAVIGTWSNISGMAYLRAGGTNWSDAGIFTNMAPTNISCTASGLTTNSLYYVTFGISNEWGRVWATNVLTFSMGAPTVDNTAGATNLAVGVTQLRGALSNGVADVTFCWGTTDGGTNRLSWGNASVLSEANIGSISSNINVSNQLYGATLFYRCYASNAFGTAWAPASRSFTIMKPVTPPPVLLNPSFETPALATHTRQARPSGASWTFVGQNECGIDSNDGTWWYPIYSPDGGQAAYMYDYDSPVSISQLVTFDRGGNYSVRFNAISREGSPAELDVQIDGSNVLVLSKGSIPQYNWNEYTTPSVAIPAGSHTIRFINSKTNEGASAIDYVRLEGAGTLITLSNTVATAVTNTSATFKATLGCTGSVYDVVAYWNTGNGGTDPAQWTNAAYVGTWTNVVSTNLSYIATGLVQNTLYYYTFRATNAADNLWADNVSTCRTTLATIPPVITAGSATNITTSEDGSYSFSLVASDPDGDPLTWSINTPASHGTATASGTGTNQTVWYAPSTNYNGADSFVVQVSDGNGGVTLFTVTLTVSAVNDPPVANALSLSVLTHTSRAVTLTGSDIDGDTLSYAIVTGPVHGSLSGTPPNVTYTPADTYSGSDSFTFKVNDGNVDSALAVVSIAVSSTILSEDFEHEWANNALAKTTNGWTSGEADLSSITNPVAATETLPSGVPFPIPYDHAAMRRMLKLNTTADMLSSPAIAGDFSNARVYADMVVNFQVSEAFPPAVSNDVNTKAAVLLKADGASTNFYVFHGQRTAGGFGEPFYSQVAGEVVKGTWCRLTVILDSTTWEGGAAEAFRVLINGKELVSPSAYGDNWKTRILGNPYTPDGGTWFLSAARRTSTQGTNLTSIAHLAFLGTGLVDDLVLTYTQPNFLQGTLLMIAACDDRRFGPYRFRQYGADMNGIGKGSFQP